MKIKSVSQQTGLTDRAIRFYIEEGLLSPAYTENYMGRRSFTFTQSDVESLRDIAVLRKFGFTVEEIREMTAQPESISRALSALKARKEKTLSDEQELLSVLVQFETNEFSDVHALVEVLSKPVESHALPNGDKDDLRSRVRRFLRSAVIFLVAWLPIFLSANALVGRLHFFHYPIIDFIELVIALFSLLPSILLMLFPRLHVNEKKRDTVKYTIILFCIASALVSPLLTLGIISRSETTDIRNYRRLDTDCIANRYDVYQALFPTWPHYFEREIPSRLSILTLTTCIAICPLWIIPMIFTQNGPSKRMLFPKRSLEQVLFLKKQKRIIHIFILRPRKKEIIPA